MFKTNFAKYAWFVTFYNVAVIAWGAVVRATGSGAGCGNHWPTCNGEIIPTPQQIETVIELAHRVTSAFSGVLILILLVWAFRRKGWNFTRVAALGALVFVIIEGGLGAALVRLELTGTNNSPLRAFMVAIHLCNTLLLLGTLSLTAWSGNFRERVAWRLNRGVFVPILIAILAALLLSAAGAVTALGDTLFPAKTLTEGFAADLDPTSSFLIRLRVIHPILAVLTSGYLLVVGRVLLRRADKPQVESAFGVLQAVVLIQLGVGVMNISLLAPVVMQVIHLVLADALWLALVVWAAESLSAPHPVIETTPEGQVQTGKTLAGQST
jgi:heme A synthase